MKNKERLRLRRIPPISGHKYQLQQRSGPRTWISYRFDPVIARSTTQQKYSVRQYYAILKAMIGELIEYLAK